MNDMYLAMSLGRKTSANMFCEFVCLRLKELCLFSEYFRGYSNMIVYSTKELNFQPSQNVYPSLNNF